MPKLALTEDGDICIIGPAPSPEVLAQIKDRLGAEEAAVVVPADQKRAFLETLRKEGGVKKFDVIIPIAGHIHMTVEARSSKEAIEKAMDTASKDNIEGWEYYEHSEGNVNSFPSPYYPEADEQSA